jgi:putative DNA methylase
VKPQPRKKLIEVALPLVAINAAAAKEKSIRHGHPSTLHLWWARRPLAACRAVLFASLVDDPDGDPRFRNLDGTVDEDRAGIKRTELFNLIEDLVKWENSNNPRVLNAARKEIARSIASWKIETGELAKDAEAVPGATAWDFNIGTAGPEAVNAFLIKHAPPVLDPFCGGGSIPLEAQRLGLVAHGSDLNPVAVLITKALIEIPPKFAGRPPVHPGADRRVAWEGAAGLAEDVRYYGKWMRDEAEKRIGHLYPKVKVTKALAEDRPDLQPYVGEELTVIAWLWARTVVSPSPAYHGVHVPLVQSYWLNTKAGREVWLRPIVDRKKSQYRFEVRSGLPTPEEKKAINLGTKMGRGCKFRCLLSNEPISEKHVKEEGHSGRLGEHLLAVVAEVRNGRVYLPENSVILEEVATPEDLTTIAVPLADDPRNLWCLGYGFDTFDKLFTPRQLVALTTFSDLVRAMREEVCRHAETAGVPRDDRSLAVGGVGASAYADAIAIYLAFAVDRMADRHSTLTRWDPNPSGYAPKIANTFSRQALPMVWNYTEGNPFSNSSGNLTDAIGWICEALAETPATCVGSCEQGDATTLTPAPATPVISTDPPYYDNIGYADLADLFYVWLRRALHPFCKELFGTAVTPKDRELIAAPHRFGGDGAKAACFFEKGLRKVFARFNSFQHTYYPLSLYYAFKQAETTDREPESDSDELVSSTGWETMLEGLIGAQFAITGTWPMRTELRNRIIASGTNALASSIVLVCRPRPADAPLATRKEFLAALRKELPGALRNLQAGNIAPVDLAQASIGPGMAVFTRYRQVLESGDKPMSVRTALGLINQTLDEVLAEQEGEFDPATRWAVAWFEQQGMEEGAFGLAETLSKAKNTAVNALADAGLVIARGGKVRLRKRDELSDDWDPADARCPIWETTQRLVRSLENQGEAATGALLPQLGVRAEAARDLAYRLYNVCERKKWAEEGRAYNGLVIAWPELFRLGQAARPAAEPVQGEMFKDEGGSQE